MPDDDLPSQLQPIQWLDPYNYPTRVTNDLALGIATAIARGVDWKTAGMMHGVAPSRLRKWLKWGEAAYHEDADGRHRHAVYLNLFLKVMQAAGMVGSAAQAQSYIDNPSWWLMHSPDQRAGWGQQAIASEPLETEAIEADTTETVSVQAGYTAEEKRQILRTLISAGAAIAPDELAATDEPESDSKRDVG